MHREGVEVARKRHLCAQDSLLHHWLLTGILNSLAGYRMFQVGVPEHSPCLSIRTRSVHHACELIMWPNETIKRFAAAKSHRHICTVSQQPCREVSIVLERM